MRSVRRLCEVAATSEVIGSISDSFRFLIDERGFVNETQRDAIFYRSFYRSEALTVTASFSDRDGFDTHFTFPAKGSQEISVRTILCALDTVRDTLQSSGFAPRMRREAAFVRDNIERLLNLS